MHEDFDTEGSIPSSVAAGVPDIPWAVIPAERGRAGLLQNGIRGRSSPGMEFCREQSGRIRDLSADCAGRQRAWAVPL
jgi:hypothetical protein